MIERKFLASQNIHSPLAIVSMRLLPAKLKSAASISGLLFVAFMGVLYQGEGGLSRGKSYQQDSVTLSMTRVCT